MNDAGGLALSDVEAVFFSSFCFRGEDATDLEKWVGGLCWSVSSLELRDGCAEFVASQGVENEPLKYDQNRDDGKNEEGPHEAAAFEKEVLKRKFHEVWEEIGLGWKRVKGRKSGRSEGLKMRQPFVF